MAILTIIAKILLLDEPTSSLDNTACARIERLFAELCNVRTLIMVAHNPDQVRRVADRVLEWHRPLCCVW